MGRCAQDAESGRSFDLLTPPITGGERSEASALIGLVIHFIGKEKMDKTKLASKFTEIVAMRLHAIDQMNNGVIPPNSVTNGHMERYRGTPVEKLPPYTVELNNFKIEVDQFVAMLIQAIDDV